MKLGREKKSLVAGVSGITRDRIPLQKPVRAARELSYLEEILSSGHLTGDGKFSKLCEKWLEEHLGCRTAMLMPSCTAALEMSALLLDVSPGDEVIMPSYTFVSTANAFVLRGAIPVFLDIRSDTLTLDENLIEAAITKKTKAVVPVHYAGSACNMRTINQIANQYRIAVVEDAAQALLSNYDKKHLGTIGHFGCISFHATKNITSGHGGAILINDERYKERAEIIRDRGTDRSQFLAGAVRKYSWIDVGSSFFVSEICSGLLLAQLQHAAWINQARRAICAKYRNGLAALEAAGRIRLPVEWENSESNGHIFYLLTNDAQQRTMLLAHLEARGIDAAFHYTPLHLSPAGRRFGRAHGTLANTERVSETIVRLPVFPSIRNEQIEAIIGAVKEFYRE